MSKLGDFLKQAREAKGLRVTDAAQALGVNTGNICHWEAGRTNPGALLPTLCEVYGVPLEDAPKHIKKRRIRHAAAQKAPAQSREVYIQIARLAAQVGDKGMAFAALEKAQ